MKTTRLSGKIILSFALLAALLFFVFLCINVDIGIHQSEIESDIRSSQKINDDWHITGTVSDSMAAYISYPENLYDYTFSVYVNWPGFSFGYFFRCGGSLVSADSAISEFTLDGCNESAFVTLNRQKVNRLEIDDGNTLQVIEIDSNKPFAMVLPVNAGIITFYTEDGNIAEVLQNSL